MSRGYGLFNICYIVFSKLGLRFFPIIGLGGGGVELGTIKIVLPLFSDIMTIRKRKASLTTGSFIGHGAVGLDYDEILGKDEQGETGLLFCIRAGY
jgi:hypothetical protein